MDTMTRREFLRRVVRAAVAGPVIPGTREQQADILRQLATLLGKDSTIGRRLSELWWRW
ncbi:MAG: hypothetical protein ACRDF9_14140 [Candidatus Limnocylindria bacterium]